MCENNEAAYDRDFAASVAENLRAELDWYIADRRNLSQVNDVLSKRNEELARENSRLRGIVSLDCYRRFTFNRRKENITRKIDWQRGVITQKYFAELCGVPVGTIKDWARNLSPSQIIDRLLIDDYRARAGTSRPGRISMRQVQMMDADLDALREDMEGIKFGPPGVRDPGDGMISKVVLSERAGVSQALVTKSVKIGMTPKEIVEKAIMIKKSMTGRKKC